MIKQKLNAQQVFTNHAVSFMQEAYDVERSIAEGLMAKYISDIDVSDPTTQHLGPDYFATQILMEENVIEYQPM